MWVILIAAFVFTAFSFFMNEGHAASWYTNQGTAKMIDEEYQLDKQITFCMNKYPNDIEKAYACTQASMDAYKEIMMSMNLLGSVPDEEMTPELQKAIQCIGDSVQMYWSDEHNTAIWILVKMRAEKCID